MYIENKRGLTKEIMIEVAFIVKALNNQLASFSLINFDLLSHTSHFDKNNTLLFFVFTNVGLLLSFFFFYTSNNIITLFYKQTKIFNKSDA